MTVHQAFPSLSVIIPTWNSSRYIAACLQSLQHQTVRPSEVLVVDNGSTDNTLEVIDDTAPASHVIWNAQNEGFCRAVNQGIRASRGRWVLVLNSDTILRHDAIETFLTAARRLGGSVGMVGGKLFRFNGRTIDSTGLQLTRAWRFHDRGSGAIDRGQFNEEGEILGPCAAAAFYRRRMLERIAVDGEYFDERFFAHVEDVDVALRGRAFGWKGWYLPDVVMYHARHGGGLQPQARQFFSLRNRYLLLMKHGTARTIARDLPFLLSYECARLPWVLCRNPFAWLAVREAMSLGPSARAEYRKALRSARSRVVWRVSNHRQPFQPRPR